MFAAAAQELIGPLTRECSIEEESMRVRQVVFLAVFLMALTSASVVQGLVWYDTGRMTVNGVELFQDADDANVYYYLPTAPALALHPDGTPQLLCMKFIDPEGESSGGLLHFLATLRMDAEDLEEIEEKLKERRPGAELAGPLPLMEGKKGEKAEVATFQVISAVLSDTEEGGFTRTVLTSGHAPVTPGSMAAVAATLDPRGATLLWESLQGATSDVSVSMAAQYEAKVRGYNATVSAEVETVYEHFSAVANVQKDYTKREIRQIVDELQHENLLKVEVFDRSEGLGIESGQMEAILNLVSDKLVSLMFDHQAGLAKMPEREQAVGKGQIPGRQKKGKFIQFFSSSGDQKYTTDNQFVLKSRKDVKRTTFLLNLAHDTTLRVPVYLAGNMGGLFEFHQENPDVFKVVNLGDPSFQVRELRFVLDGEWAAAFEGMVNFVSVQIHKEYDNSDQPAVDSQTQLSSADVTDGQLERSLRYPRLGTASSDWLEYQYRVNWSLLRRGPVSQPNSDEWISSVEPVVTLRPPLSITEAELEVDRDAMIDRGVRVGVVEVRSTVLGKQETRRSAVLRISDAEPVVMLSAVHDPDSEPEVRVSWVAAEGGSRQQGEWLGLGAGYLWVEVPDLLGGES